MNLGELRGAVNRRTGIAVDNTALNEWINWSLTEIGLEYPWPWLEKTTTVTTVAGTTTYTLTPTTVRQITSVKDSSGNIYDPASVRDLIVINNLDQVTAQFSDGFWYATDGTQLYIAPTPADVRTLTVRYVSNEPTLVADIDTPLLPASYHQTVIELAALEVTTRRNSSSTDSRKSDMYMKDYNRIMQKLKREAARFIGAARTPRIRPGAGW